MRLTAASVVLLAATLAGAGLTARLGLWQLDRAAQKSSLQQSLDERRALPPLPAAELAEDAATAALQHHRRIQLSGQWRPEATVYLENRQMNGHPGFFVVTPLQLADGSAVLVQRGWQPRDQADRSRVVPPPSPAGPVQLQGRIAPPPARLYDFGAGESGPIRQNLDIDAFAAETRLRLRPLSVLQEDSAGNTETDNLRRQWPAPAAGVHKHHGYAFQWFALSALICFLYVWFQFIRPWRQARAQR
jgi:surfeit locus 1 family protein